MKKPVLTDKYKLERLIEDASFSRSELARLLEVGYKTVYRWLDKGIKPQLAQARRIDELFKEHIDLSDWVEDLKKQAANPLKILKHNQTIREKFFLLLTYHSNAIEGSRMTIKETEQVIHGQQVRGKELFEELEVINHYNALLYMLEIIKPDFKITEEYILKLHAIVMYNFHNKLPGKYRTGYVNLTNTEKKLPTAQKVPSEMRKLLKGINDYRNKALRQVAQDHYTFEAIHPFFDGNGRVGRLIMITQLLAKGYAPAIIEIEDQYKYYLALSKGDFGDYRNLIQMICESVMKGYALLFADA